MAVGGFAFAPDGGARAALGRLRRRRAARARGRAGAARERRAPDASPCSPRPTTCPRSWSRASSGGSRETRAAAAAAARPGAVRPLPDRLDRAARALRGGGRARRRADPRRRAGEDRARARGRRARAGAARRRGGVRRPARRLRLLLRLLRRPRRRRVRRRLARAAGAPRGPARVDRRARRLDAPVAPTPRSTTTSASSCCARDKDREEQAIVTRRIARALRPLSVWVAAPDEPALVRVANIQHLATPIRAQLTQPRSALELAGLLHPTPAVGGEPHGIAAPLIPALEGLDRGWYAGPVGWTDANEDGEFCVALRCALLRGAEARLYAGVGVVRDSDPAGRAGGDRGQARRAAAGAVRLGAPLAPDLEHLAHASPCGRRCASPAGARRARSARTRAARARSRARGSGGPSCRPARCRPRRCPWRSDATAALAGGVGDLDQPLLCHAGHARRRRGRPPRRAGAAPRSRPGRCGRGSASRCGSASARPSAPRSSSGVATRLVREPVQRGGVGEVEAVRRRDVPLEAAPSRRHGQEVEDPAAVVVEQHDRQRQPQPTRRRAARRCRARARRRRSGARPGRAGGGDAEGGRDGAVDAVRAAVGEHARRVRAGGEERLDVADRHRGGDDSVASWRQQRAELGGDARLAQLGRAPARSPPAAARSGVRPGLEPVAVAGGPLGRAPRSNARGSAASASRPRRAGSCQAFSGSSATWSVSSSSRASHWRSGLDVGRSPTRSTSSGRAARPPSPRRAAARRSARPPPAPRRAPDVGSASSGSPARSAKPASAAPSRGSRSARPATISARGAPLELAGERLDCRRPAGAAALADASPTAARRRGRRRPAPPSAAARRARAARAARSSGAPGPGRPSSAVQNARHASWRSQRSRSGVAGWSSTSKNHLAALP